MNKLILFTLVVFLGVACSSQKTPRSSNKKGTVAPPNLLVIMTDEHNFRTLGCYRETLPEEQAFMWGKNVVETPNIDWLADNGALSTSFYATTPVCSPSRAAFVSGRYPQHTPVAGNDIPLSDDVITFASVLQEKGYATGYAGKWHLDGTAKPGWAPARKFGFEDNRFMFNRGHWKQLEEGTDGPKVSTVNKKGTPNYNIEGANAENYTTDFLTRKTIDFIDQNKTGPFCYMLSLPDPHGPNTVRPPYDQLFNPDQFVQARTFAAPYDQSIEERPVFKMRGHNMAAYHGMVKCIDDNIGKIIENLKRHDLLDNTIIVFTSDHGDLCGEHGLLNKGNPYEASARVPFIVYYPKKIPNKKTIHEALSSIDFMPTMLDLMEVDPPDTVEGRNAAALFTDDRLPDDWKDVVIIRGTPNRCWLAAITDRYKLAYFKDQEPVLYDLQLDPDEVVNYFAKPDYQEVVKQLSKEIELYAKKYHDPHFDQETIRSYFE